MNPLPKKLCRCVRINKNWVATNADVAATWKLFYAVIYQANGIIEKMPGSPVNDSAKGVYIAEAKKEVRGPY